VDGAAAAGAIEGIEGFFAWETGALATAPGVALVVDGRVVVGLAEEPKEVRGVALVVGASAAARDVKGRFAAVVLAGAIVDRRSDAAGFPGELRVAAVDDSVVLRAAGFLFSSPEVMEERSGSASDVAPLEANPVLLAAVPAAGRVGGLFRLDPAVPVRIVELPSGFDAVVELRALLAAAGRRAPAATALVEVVPGRRGGTFSAFEGVEEAILRRVEAVVDV
jgi:hypothetical protein